MLMTNPYVGLLNRLDASRSPSSNRHGARQQRFDLRRLRPVLAGWSGIVDRIGRTCIGLLAIALVGCAPSQLTKLVSRDNGRSKKSDTVRTGVSTSEEAEDEGDLGPYGFRVTWIAWDSTFRDTDLRIGDRIVGVDDDVYRRSDRRDLATFAVGSWGEPQYWERRGRGDGDKVTLRIWRRGKQISIEGKLRADRFYYTPKGRAALGEGGPDRLTNDGFRGAWSGWYERRIRDWTRVLDGGWRRGVNTRMTLAKHLEDKPRVDYLVEHYPGPFAESVASDWKRVHDSLLGPERTITADDLEYRALGDARAAKIAAAAKKARKAFLDGHAAQTVDPFPAVDPINGDLERVKGKVVVLPELGPRDWISEGGHGYLVAGDSRRGIYFIDGQSPAFAKLMNAVYRYQEQVTPKIKETFAIVARIRGEPEMRVVGSQAVTGLAVDPIAATVGGAVFVDLSSGESDATFAGQAELKMLSVPEIDDDSSPRQVMKSAIAALKVGAKDDWTRLFAPWYLSIYGSGRFYFNPLYHAHTSDLSRAWVRGRHRILEQVCAMKVVDVGLVHRLTSGDEFADAPVVDEVLVEVEHVGKFPEGYRPFNDVNVNRVWRLQRLDGGPWRIVTRKAI
jgi:hypothetical protein